ncbi:MAG: hypothetical protein ACYTE8_00415 [Planctomycetota bacterium]|jgi:RimJ/RimL family protein N-acetyltransferase
MEGITIVPYTHIDGVPTFKDSELEALYNRVVSEGIEPTLFHDDSVNSVEGFIRSAKDSDNTLMFIIMDDDEPMGCIWLNRFERVSAQGHFVYFKDFWGTGKPLAATKKFLRLATHILFPTIIGIMPSWNRVAHKHCMAAGMHKLGRVPAMLYSKEKQCPTEATIFYSTKEDFKDENLH